VLDKFSRCDNIDFAYPTQRFYDNMHEGKQGTRGAAVPSPADKL